MKGASYFSLYEEPYCDNKRLFQYGEQALLFFPFKVTGVVRVMHKNMRQAAGLLPQSVRT